MLLDYELGVMRTSGYLWRPFLIWPYIVSQGWQSGIIRILTLDMLKYNKHKYNILMDAKNHPLCCGVGLDLNKDPGSIVRKNISMLGPDSNFDFFRFHYILTRNLVNIYNFKKSKFLVNKWIFRVIKVKISTF